MSIEQLIEAVIQNNPQRVDEILQLGVNPNNYEDEDQLRPIHFAALYNSLDVVPLLKKAGADFTIINSEGSTPLDIAKQHNYHEMVELLIQLQPKFNTDDDKVLALLVEDIPALQLASAAVLEKLQCHVDVAEDGRSALKLLRERNYDIVFLDLILPDIDGISVASQVRSMQNGNATIPIVALTIHTDNDYKDRCHQAGITDFMEKPLTLSFAKEILDDLVYLSPDS